MRKFVQRAAVRRVRDRDGVVHDSYLDHSDYHYYDVTYCGRRAEPPEFWPSEGAMSTCVACAATEPT